MALLACACGGGDDPPNPAVTKCQDFAGTWCKSAMDCLVTIGTLTQASRDANYSTCRDTAIAAVPCKKAVSVGATYEQCLSDIQTMDCSKWAVPTDQLSSVQPPDTCKGVVLISP